MSDNTSPAFNSGSHWLRWDPHVHAPGTLFNDQFKGDWDAYVKALEVSTPTIRAVGVTDYYLLDTYRSVLEQKSKGRLPDCELIFPNVEIRFSIGTSKSWLNAHLLVSPDDPDHLSELERFLARLTFDAYQDRFSCRPEDLIRLGRKADQSKKDERAALRHGADQFKVSFEDLRREYDASGWAKANILIGVAAKQTDGTSSLRDGSDQTLRQELERFAHIIFSSNANQREFWLGRKDLSATEIKDRYDGLKPCLHGSDAHCVSKTGNPDANRFSWLKGQATFDTLRQAYIDPAGRAFVGEEHPASAISSEVISKVVVNGAPWLLTPEIKLNPGLVAVIGARGSGKTALADMIAAGCDAHVGLAKESFLERAREHLGGASTIITWQSGETEKQELDDVPYLGTNAYPRARYLSQQFVENLCSSSGLSDGLLVELERVIFDAHSVTQREGTVNFGDLRELRSARFRQARAREEESLAMLSERINIELEKKEMLSTYKAQVLEKELLVKRLTEDRGKLVAKGSEVRVLRLEQLTKATETVGGYVRYYKAQEQQILLMQDEISTIRTTIAPNDLRAIKSKHVNAGIGEDEWNIFFRDYRGDVDGLLLKMLTSAKQNCAAWIGTAPIVKDGSSLPLIDDDAILNNHPLLLLEAEIARLQKLVSVDQDTARRFSDLSKKIAIENELLRGLKEKLVDSEGAALRLEQLSKEREATYQLVFSAILSEQRVLQELYEPIRVRLGVATGTLRKLSFSITRTVDIDSWAAQGEALLNLAKKGPFRGKGALREAAKELLEKTWMDGGEVEVMEAMRSFKDAYQSHLLEHSPIMSTDQSEYRRWTKRLAQWLYGTDHINVRYSINYDDIDIQKLSPGTRGIVLLLLYLSLDDSDTRPLIIDQPEENLDPKSIYDDLVSLFLAAKLKRQVIMVTHNANLVINTDADQIIVASSGPHGVGELPPITYISGGLECSEIRKLVCDILEGGESAFKERARRIRVRLSR